MVESTHSYLTCCEADESLFGITHLKVQKSAAYSLSTTSRKWTWCRGRLLHWLGMSNLEILLGSISFGMRCSEKLPGSARCPDRGSRLEDSQDRVQCEYSVIVSLLWSCFHFFSSSLSTYFFFLFLLLLLIYFESLYFMLQVLNFCTTFLLLL